MAEIDEYMPQTGRILKEDGSTANIGDVLEAIETAAEATQAALEAGITATTEEQLTTKGTGGVIDLSAVVSIALGANTLSVDLFVATDTNLGDVYMGFAENPAAADAPYELAKGVPYRLEVNPADEITLYFAPKSGAFDAGDRIRWQEWERS